MTGCMEMLYGIGLCGEGEAEAAEALLRATLGVFMHSSGVADYARFMCMMGLARCRQERGDLAEAEALLREAHGGAARPFGAQHSHTLSLQRRLAALLLKRGGAEAAAEVHEMASEVLVCLRRQHADPRHWATLVALRVHGEAAAQLAGGDSDAAALTAAVAELRESLEGLRKMNAYEARESARALAVALGAQRNSLDLVRAPCES